MIINQSTRPSISNSNLQEINTLVTPTNQAKKKQLVAKWLVDENSRLYCKWIKA